MTSSSFDTCKFPIYSTLYRAYIANSREQFTSEKNSITPYLILQNCSRLRAEHWKSSEKENVELV